MTDSMHYDAKVLASEVDIDAKSNEHYHAKLSAQLPNHIKSLQDACSHEAGVTSTSMNWSIVTTRMCIVLHALCIGLVGRPASWKIMC